MTDGRLNKCKECAKKDVRDNRADKVEYYRDYDRRRGNRQSQEYRTEYREKFPKKYKAINAISNAVRSGKMKMMPCEICGKKETHGHHDDYAFPLTVRWLCALHHRQWHDENGAGANGI